MGKIKEPKKLLKQNFAYGTVNRYQEPKDMIEWKTLTIKTDESPSKKKDANTEGRKDTN